jgi:hypothetical protein
LVGSSSQILGYQYILVINTLAFSRLKLECNKRVAVQNKSNSLQKIILQNTLTLQLFTIIIINTKWKLYTKIFKFLALLKLGLGWKRKDIKLIKIKIFETFCSDVRFTNIIPDRSTLRRSPCIGSGLTCKVSG